MPTRRARLTRTPPVARSARWAPRRVPTRSPPTRSRAARSTAPRPPSRHAVRPRRAPSAATTPAAEPRAPHTGEPTQKDPGAEGIRVLLCVSWLAPTGGQREPAHAEGLGAVRAGPTLRCDEV